MYSPFENYISCTAIIKMYCNLLYPFQNLARMFLISHFLTPTIIVIFLFNGSNPQRTLNACLGQFELNYLETSTDLCTLESASLFLRIGCWMAYILYFILSCNLAESYMLYRCFKKIEEQTNDSKDFLTLNSYIRRRKWVPLGAISMLRKGIGLGGWSEKW